MATPALNEGIIAKDTLRQKKAPEIHILGDYKKCNTMNQVTVMKLDLECNKQREAQKDR